MDNMVDIFYVILLTLGALFIGFKIGYIWRGITIFNHIKTMVANAEVKQQELISKLNSSNDAEAFQALRSSASILNLNMLKYEIYQDQHMFYFEETGEFVCQASSLDELASRYGQISKQHGMVIDYTGTTDGFFIIDGKVTNDLNAAK
jgi:hypothetical protein